MPRAIRRNVNDLSVKEKDDFVKAVKKLKADKTYDVFVQIHHEVAQLTDTSGRNPAHGGPAFLPWHREFLLRFESQLHRVLDNENFGLPYWDWASDQALPDPTKAPIWDDDFMGGDGSPVSSKHFGGRGNWKIWTPPGTANPNQLLVRHFGRRVTSLPSFEDVATARAHPTYDEFPWDASSVDSFRNQLEGFTDELQPQMHNRVHMWVGGSMVPMTSPNDPVFFLHHCNVDRLWAAWQGFHRHDYLPASGGPSGHNLDDRMMVTLDGKTDGPLRTPREMLDCVQLGYVYDRVAIKSAAFPGAVLRMDGGGEVRKTDGGGKVNCQSFVDAFETFKLVPQGEGTLAIASLNFKNIFLRMDGRGVAGKTGDDLGKVNCQSFVDAFEKFNFRTQGDGTVAIESVEFPGVFLRMDGTGVAGKTGNNLGFVNCQSFVGPLEKFVIMPIL